MQPISASGRKLQAFPWGYGNVLFLHLPNELLQGQFLAVGSCILVKTKSVSLLLSDNNPQRKSVRFSLLGKQAIPQQIPAGCPLLSSILILF